MIVCQLSCTREGQKGEHATRPSVIAASLLVVNVKFLLLVYLSMHLLCIYLRGCEDSTDVVAIGLALEPLTRGVEKGEADADQDTSAVCGSDKGS